MLTRVSMILVGVIACTAYADPPADKQAVVAEVMNVLDQYMVAFNKMDVQQWEKTFHFPHYRLASGEMKVLQQPGEQDQARLRATFKEMGWHHSGWNRREVIHLSDSKVHVDTQFARYRADGSVLNSFDSLYILIKRDGRWGIKMRSSFAQ